MAGGYVPRVKGVDSAFAIIIPKLSVEGVIPGPAFLSAHKGTGFPSRKTFMKPWNQQFVTTLVKAMKHEPGTRSSD
jgi:hypothetical protein